MNTRRMIRQPCLHAMKHLVVMLVGVTVMGCNQEAANGPTVSVEKNGVDAHGNESQHRSSADLASTPHEADVSAEEQLKSALALADNAMRTGDAQASKKHLQAILVKWPGEPEAVFRLARVEAGMGNAPLAVELLDDVPENHRLRTAALGQSADWLVEMGQYKKAIKRFRQLLVNAPENDYARHRLGYLFNLTGQRQDAVKTLTPLVPRGKATERELRSFDDLTSPFEWTQPGANNSSVPLGQALGFYTMQKFEKAHGILGELVEKGDADASVYACYAVTLSTLQRFEECAEVLEQSPEETQLYAPYWIAVGDLKAYKQQHDLAAGAYLHALQLDTTSLEAHRRLVNALGKLGKAPKAKKVEERLGLLDDASATMHLIDPMDPKVVELVAELAADLIDLGRRDLAVAWTFLYANRHQKNRAFYAWAAKNIQQWSELDHELLQQRRLGGLSPSEFPRPDFDAEGKSVVPETSPEPDFEWHQHGDPIFVDVAKQTGLKHAYLNGDPRNLRGVQVYEQMGAGAVALDFDLDGRVDFYLGQGASDPREPSGRSNVLFRLVESEYADVTRESGTSDFGYAQGVTFGDLNQDGFPDLVVGNLGGNVLFLNQGDGTFARPKMPEGWSEERYTTGVAIADVTHDGLPDVIEINYVEGESIYDPMKLDEQGFAIEGAGPGHFRAANDYVWESMPDQSMRPWCLVDRDQHATADEAAKPALGLVVTDLDRMPGLEIFVANDLQSNQLWRCDTEAAGDSLRFRDHAVVSGLGYGSRGLPNACMGVAHADFDRNGFSDLFITNFIDEWVNLFMQTPEGTFRDLAGRYGLGEVSSQVLGFGCQAIDFDNNGATDVVVANGNVDDSTHKGFPFEMPTQLFINQGEQFSLVLPKGDPYWADKHLGRCLITCDYNADGRLDFLIVDMKEPVVLMENRTATNNHWFQLRLAGDRSERDAIGSIVEVTTQSGKQTAVVSTGDGFQGRNEALVSFGLGESDVVDSVVVRWPSGAISQFNQISSNQVCLAIEGQGELWQQQPR